MTAPSSSAVASTNDHAPRLTVLQLVPALEQGGVERGTIEIAEALVAAGHRALVASNGGRLEAALKRVGGEHVKLPLNLKMPWDIRRNAKALEEIIRDEAVDIVHARSRAPAWAGERAARATKTPFVTTYHGTYSENSSLKKRYNAVMAKGQPTIAISEFIAELVQNRYKKPASEIVVIPRGADINIFAEELVSTPRTIALAERWGVADDPRPIVLLPARLSPWKGHNTLIAAAKGLKERAAAAGTTPDLNIVFSGGGSSAAADKLLKAIDDAGVNDLVRWVDHTADMEAAYKLSAVVVSASTEPEAFGRVAVEAQAMGRPVIATAHGGSLETIDAGQTGWLYPPGDATALADAIEEALALDSSGRAHMGMAGRARIRSRFTIDAMKRATLQVYEDAAIPR